MYSFFSPHSGDYFYSTDAAQKKVGYKPRGVVGFLFPNAICGATPLYHLSNKRRKIHFFTMSASERAMAVKNGYNNEGVVGYMFKTKM
jgi:Repeat of unknown function (DUF5648)